MLKYLFFILLFCVSTPCFCGTNQSVNTTFTSVSVKNKLDKKHQKVYSKLAFLKTWMREKRFPIFGVVSIISGLLGLLGFSTDRTILGLVLLLISSIFGIISLIIGEFWLLSILGILSTLLIIALILYVSTSHHVC